MGALTKVLLFAALAVALAVAWHLAQAQTFHGMVATAPGTTLTVVKVNPLTNEVTAISEADPAVSDASEVSTRLEPAIEAHLNDAARDRLDLYAMLVPYRANVAVHLEPTDSA